MPLNVMPVDVMPLDVMPLDTCGLHAIENIFPRPLLSVSRRRSAYSSSFALEELEVVFRDGDKTEVMFKDVGPGAMLDGAAAVKPAFLFNPQREIQAYRSTRPSLN